MSDPEALADAGTDPVFDAEFERLVAAQDEGRTDAGEAEPKQDDEPGADEDPNPQPNADDGAAAGEDNPPPAQAEASGDDIWTGASEAQIAAFKAAAEERDRLAHKIRSDDGRVATYQRQIAELQRKLAGGASRDPAGRQETETKPDAKAGFVPPELEAKIDRFRDEYPEIAEPILELVEASQRRVEGTVAAVESMTAERREAFHTAQFAEVVSAHPDYLPIVQSAEFRAFYDQAPQFIRDGIERNGTDIQDAREVSAIITLFKTAKAVPSNPPPAEGGSKSNLDVRRREQLKAGSFVPPAGTATGTGIVDDFDIAFEAAAAAKEGRPKR